MAHFGAKNGIFGPQQLPQRPPCDEFNTQTLPIWCPVIMVTKNLEYVPIIWLCGQKSLNFWPKNQFFFLRYDHITQFFGLKQTRLNGIISSPYPQVTLVTFGFPVDVRSAAQPAVFWHQLPKMGLFWAKNAIFSTLCPYKPLFWAQTDPDQWDHISPYPKVILDAFGFPVDARLSARQSAGRFLAPIAQNGPFLG